jgi:hypothetical protein
MTTPPKGSSGLVNFEIDDLLRPLSPVRPGKYYQEKYGRKDPSKLTNSYTQTEKSCGSTDFLVSQLKSLRCNLSGALSSIDGIIDFLGENSEAMGRMETADDCKGETGKIEHPVERKEEAVQTTSGTEFDSDPSPLKQTNDYCFSPGPSTASSGIFSSQSDSTRNTRVGRGARHSKIASSATVAEVFVFNVERSVTVSDLMDYLKGKLTVLGLTQVSHPSAHSKSFVLSVPLEERDAAHDPNIWPLGLQFRRFIRPLVGRLAAPTW